MVRYTHVTQAEVSPDGIAGVPSSPFLQGTYRKFSSKSGLDLLVACLRISIKMTLSPVMINKNKSEKHA